LYPETTLAQARERHQAARKLLDSGIDPAEQKKADKRAAELAAANSFEAVTSAWLAERQPSVSVSTHTHTLGRMQNDVFPWLGKRPITEIDAPEILAVLKRIDARGRGTAPTRCGQKSAWCSAMASGRGIASPTRLKP
jgi:hypothetical protein